MPPKSSRQSNVNELLDTWGRKNRRLADVVCGVCGNQFKPLRASSSYCSRKCATSKNGGWNRKAETWWINNKGYVEGRIWMPDGSQRRVKKHRHVIERKIGRALMPHEDVHHKDGNPLNNDLSNLEVLLHGTHSTITNRNRTYTRGYRLDLSVEERRNRAIRMKANRAKATGETK